ncbi:MAG TPA: hypothetical protein ENN21_00285 [Spirochaetes bacterium]|nr:hypothetical protein [Spirochaetota bacterium]
MKRIVLTMALCVTLAGGAAIAEENRAAKKEPSREKDHYFTVQAFYPISTNKSKEDSTWANFTLIYGQIGSVVGADLSYIASIVRHDMKGLQGSSVFAYTGENLKGVALSGVTTLVKENLSGVQAAGVFSYTGKEFRGFQASGVVNFAGDKMKGMQISPVNIAGDTSGMQLGVVNIAGDVRGVQFGIVNISKQMKGVPIGLVNIAENGGVDIVAWGSSLMAANAGVRFRAGYVYTMLAAGCLNQENNNPIDETLASQFYLGARIPAGRLYFDADLGFMLIDNKDLYSERGEKDRYVSLGRAMVGFHVTKLLAVFAGGGAAYLLNEGQDFKEGKWEPHYLGGVALEF